MPVKLWSPESVPGVAGSVCQVAHFTCCWREASAPHHVAPSVRLLECPYDMAASFPQSVCFKKEQGGIGNAFYDLVSEVTLCCLHLILFVRSDSLTAVESLGRL